MGGSLDTDDETDRVQVEVYRKMGGPGRLATAFRLNGLARRTALAGIHSRHPDYSEEELRLAYARLVLGDDTVRQAWPDRQLVDP
jgi:hypothetical protein